MLLTESERAKQLRTRILDIVIATINGRAGGGTKYINWRDRDYLPTAIKSKNYRKNFTQAVGKGISFGKLLLAGKELAQSVEICLYGFSDIFSLRRAASKSCKSIKNY